MPLSFFKSSFRSDLPRVVLFRDAMRFFKVFGPFLMALIIQVDANLMEMMMDRKRPSSDSSPDSVSLQISLTLLTKVTVET